ncbi:hypothetical protein GCM10022393_28570 [Aquimarina addita]|uniref:Anti-sigma factor n=1 Tax=Aquimarina addita TaxID=870485 RepID=A0ABP6UR69_9FLAO
MAPLKFEDSIKEKLEQRAIKPSKGSWEKLSNQMDMLERKKRNSGTHWYVIAASIVGVLILTSVFFNNKNTSDSKYPQLVDTSNKELEKIKNEELLENKNSKKIVSSEKTEGLENKKKKLYHQPEVSGVNHVVSSKKHILFNKHTNHELMVDKLAVIEKKNSVFAEVADSLNPAQENHETRIKGTLISDKNIANVVSQIKELQKNDSTITTNEIDQLLLKAQRQITARHTVKSNTISASALLLDVETELDETFKNRVFEALKSGFQKVKTAVAEREN